MNTLFWGDNVDVLRQHVPDASVDLIYLDPPFQSGRDYRMARSRKSHGEHGHAGAFKDTWKWGPEAETAYSDVERSGEGVAKPIRALRSMLGDTDVMAYLCMIAPRLVELRRVLRATGSLYLHCDPTASHYLKMLLDGVFGPTCFRNEVIWRYRRWPAKARHFQCMHDVLLFYTRSPGRAHTFNTLYGYEKLAESTLKTFGRRRQQADFSSGHRRPSVADVDTEGPPLSDVWEIGVIAAAGRERTGYPTQKPEALLERVIRASSHEGDVVLDPFCGCGTALVVADRLNRQWIGIDLASVAIDIARARMRAASAGARELELFATPRHAMTRSPASL